MVPILRLANRSFGIDEGRGSSNDLNQLGRDRGLPLAVIRERELAEHLPCALGRVLHGAHPRCVLAAVVLEHRVVQGGSKLELCKVLEDVRDLVGSLNLVDVELVAARIVHLLLNRLGSEDGGEGGLEGDGGLELVEHHMHDFRVVLEQLLCNDRCLGEGHAELVGVLDTHGKVVALCSCELRPALVAH
jgi:hypothetical protein